MREWTRATRPRLCGKCGLVIGTGEAIQEIRFLGITKVRCSRCETAPPDLPPLIVKDTREDGRPMNRAPVQSVARILPLDWKARGAGREPGQEG